MKEIRKILSHFDLADASESFALASVVNVEESSYRRIGARMLVSSNGQWTGGISGGCLEGDALRRSQQAIFNNKPTRVVYDTMDDDQKEIGVGLGCNGLIEVLFTPIDRTNPDNPIEELRRVLLSEGPSILLKIIESPEDGLLAKSRIIDERFSHTSFYGLDMESLAKAIQETRIKRRPQVIEVVNDKQEAFKILVEYIRPETKLVIIGDNYDVLALTGMAIELGWEIHIVGRKKKIPKKLYHSAKAIYEYEEADQVPIDEFTAVVLMSHDYNWDKRILPSILERVSTYVGMLGPRKRLEKMQTELQLGDLNKKDCFFSPVGLDIGAESPEEIAVSICAEIISVMRKREGRPLKYRPGTIHERF